MGIAYSPPDRVIHADIDASSAHCLLEGLHRAVQLAGWEVDREIEDGYVYILTSPQDASLQMKVQIQDTGRELGHGLPVLDVIFMDFEEENISQAYKLSHTEPKYGQPVRRVRAHITPCQIFTYAPGTGEPGNAVMGGIPWVDPNTLESTEDPCADEDSNLKTTRAWWSCADWSTVTYVSQVPSFRTSWHCGCSATLHNNDFVVDPSSPGELQSLLRITPLQKPSYFEETWGNANFAYPLILRWTGTEEPLHLDPLLAWSSVHPVKIRGQLWDAFYRTKFVAWESPLGFDSQNWFSYSSGRGQAHIYSSGDIFTLYLRDPGLKRFECDEPEPETPTESNYAY